MKWKKNRGKKKLWYLFMCSLFVVVILFVKRVYTGEAMTEPSAAEIIRLSKIYQPGKYYDRNKIDVTDCEQFKEVIQIDVEKTKNSKMTLAGVTPWTFGQDDNRFHLRELICPWNRRVGEDTLLTYDKDVQVYINQLAKNSGYDDVLVVVSNWETGAIYATLGEVYSETLHSGSTIKPILAAAVLTLQPELKDYTYDCCEDSHVFATEDGTYRIACSGNRYHGKLNMEKAMVKSCNGYFISLLQQVPKEELLKVLEKWGFDSVLSFEQFMFWDQTFLNGSERESDYLMAAIGQGNVKITPFGLNVCTNALINGKGEINEPFRILAKTMGIDHKWKFIRPNKRYEFCDDSVAESVRSMMLKVASPKTGRNYAMEGFAAKTGTAQKGGNLNTVWTTGGLVSLETPYSVTVCIDNVSRDTSSSVAGEMAKEILTYMIGGK